MLKKTMSILFSLILLAAAPHSAYATSIIVEVDGLNIRSGPGTDYSVIGKVNSGEQFPILREEGEWIEITYGDRKGWVSKQYITVINKEEEEKKSFTIEKDRVHIRNGPSTDNKIIYFAKKGETFEILSENNQWYEIKNDRVTGYVYKPFVTNARNKEQRFIHKTIILDPGHGGHDVGAIGATGTFEKHFTDLTTNMLREQLSSLGATVLLTRERDEFVSLASRASYANMTDGDMFISIHYNSFTEQPDVTGIETFYYRETDKQLAQFIQQEIINETGDKDRGISYGDFYVLRQTAKPSLLIELGFISNPETEKYLMTDWYQEKIVKGIVNGLQKYFSMP